MTNSNRGTPIGVKHASRGTFDIRPDVGRVRNVEVGAEAVFNPRVLAVKFNHAGAAGGRAGDLAVAEELMHNGRAEIDVTLVVRALQAGSEAQTAGQAVQTVDLVAGLAEREAVAIEVGVGDFCLAVRRRRDR